MTFWTRAARLSGSFGDEFENGKIREMEAGSLTVLTAFTCYRGKGLPMPARMGINFSYALVCLHLGGEVETRYGPFDQILGWLT